MDEEKIPQPEIDATAAQEAEERTFGEENRNRLINRYFLQYGAGAVTPGTAWQHVYCLV